MGGINAPVTSNPVGKDKDSAEGILPTFNGKVKLLQQALNTVQFNNQEISRLKNEHASATLNEQEKRISEELNKKIDTNNQLCKNVKDQLATLQTEVEEAKRKDPDEPETRIRIVNYQALSNKFSQIIKESQAVQLEFKQSVKNKISRQVKFYDSSLSDQQVEEITNDPEGAAKVLSNKMLGAGHVKLQNAVSDIQDKYKDILKLERSVEVMHQMFVDMAMLVQAQGEIIDNIEVNIKEAKDYVHKGVGQLKSAQVSHEKSRRLQWMMMLCLLIAGLIAMFMFGII